VYGAIEVKKYFGRDRDPEAEILQLSHLNIEHYKPLIGQTTIKEKVAASARHRINLGGKDCYIRLFANNEQLAE